MDDIEYHGMGPLATEWPSKWLKVAERFPVGSLVNSGQRSAVWKVVAVDGGWRALVAQNRVYGRVGSTTSNLRAAE